ncbi:MAG: MBL fold metallo-hydrolase [Bacteroidia bacterium]|nr:MBL fold metallo-hydrolase [Bacteroidia bacterium]
MMNRRELLRNAAVFGCSIPFLGYCSRTSAIETFSLDSDIHKFTIGEFQCTIFRDTMWKYLAKDYFINADEVDLENALSRYNITPDNIPSPFISMLLQRGNEKILIDSGIGFSEEPLVFRGNEYVFKGQVNHLLAKEGINHSDITDVIISHFHPDHIGGIFSGKGNLNFPNAKFHTHQKEWDFWHSPSSENQSPLFKIFVEQNTTPLKDQNLNLINGDFQEIIPGITAVVADGHTPGQIALIIGSDKNQLIYISDAFLHPLHIERLHWQTNYDFDHQKAKQTRIKLLELANENEMMINAFHFEFPGLGNVEKVKENWKWNYLQS